MNDLSQEDHDSTSRQETRLKSALLCSLVQIARVVIVRVILVGVLGVMIVVLIGHDEVRVNVVIYVAIFVVIFCNWRCTLYTMYCVNRTFIVDGDVSRASVVLKRAMCSWKLGSPQCDRSIDSPNTTR